MARSYWLSLCCLLIAAGALPAATVSFNAPRSYPTPGNPQSIASADLNGDGHPDLVEMGLSGDVLVLLNNGKGVFQTATSIATGHGLGMVIAADVNGDGKVDLVIANKIVWVLLGKGDGTFQPAVKYAEDSAESVAVADLNGDGVPDLAAADYATGSVSILLGKGDGTFSPAGNFATTASIVSVLAGDLDGDGNQDLALASISSLGSSKVFLLFGNGDGTFQPVVDYAVAHGADYLAVADFDGDGKADLAAAGESTVTILLSNGDRTFHVSGTYNVGDFPNFIAVGDVNGDGKLDLVTTSVPLGRGYDPNTNNESVLLGKGDGTFHKAVEYVAGNYPQAVAIGDFDGDGKADLAVANFSSDTVTILLGTGKGAFEQPASFHVKGGANFVAAGDFNGDGKSDLVTAGIGFNPGKGSLWLGKGDGTFQAPTTFPTTGSVHGLAVADFNRDSHADLVAADFYSDNVSVILGNGDGTLQPPVTYPAHGFPTSVAVADLNGDGKLDLAVVNGAGAKAASVLLGNGDGTFRAPVRYPVGINPACIAIGDFNGDGKPDLAISNLGPRKRNTGRKVSILLGNGDGTYQPAVNYKVEGVPLWLTVADWNGDGKPDIVVAAGPSRKATILFGNGDGTFRVATQEFSTGANWVGTADFDGDGNLDLAMITGAGTVSIVPGDGKGGFGPEVSYSAGITAKTAVVMKFRGGKPSLVVATGHGVTVLRNMTP